MPILSEKQVLMRKVQAAGLAMYEANLYLDSHPTCPMGLKYFEKHRTSYEKLTKEYESKFGAITADNASTDKKWGWVQTPFPWERGES